MRPLDQPLRLRIRGSADDHLRAEGAAEGLSVAGQLAAPPAHRALAVPHHHPRHRTKLLQVLPPPGEQVLGPPRRNQHGRQPTRVAAHHRQYRQLGRSTGTGPGASVGRSLRDGGRSCCGASAGPCRDAPAMATGAASSPPPRHVRTATVLRWCSDVRHVTGTTGTEPARGHRYARPPSPNSSRCHRRTPVDIVTEQQRKLLGEAPELPRVDVRSPMSRRFPEVALRPLRIVGSVDVTQSLQRFSERIDRLKRPHRDLEVDHRLGGQARNGSRTDVVDANRDVAERFAQRGTQVSEVHHPGRLIVDDLHMARH